MKRVLIVGSQHGNELLGERLYKYLCVHPVEGLHAEFYLANPRARKLRVRYVQSDMNRSYGPGEPTYERKCAARLLGYLQREHFDLVIDAHTTTVDQLPCFIVSDTTGPAAAFMRACHVSNVVVMTHPFVGQSLIGHVPQAVSLEISVSRLDDRLLTRLREDLAVYAADDGPHARKRVFTVRELLKKDEVADPDAPVRNFYRAAGGFYPVLVGENSYKKQTDYLGFKAVTRQLVTI